MHTRSARRSIAAPVLVALSMALSAAAQSSSEQVGRNISPLPPAAAAARPFVDVAADGTVWARGQDFKASFGVDGTAFIPFLGSDAPRNFPLHLRLDQIVAGATEVALSPAATPRAHDSRVDFDRGTVVETWLLAKDHAEQRFVFPAAVGVGALQVRMQVATELAVASDSEGGFTFANERGGVRYGRAIAFDAHQRRVDVASACDGQSLLLTVPAEFVATATFPLTIDPVLMTFVFTVSTGSNPDETNTDCAYVGTYNGLYASVHEELYSQTDHDVAVVTVDRDGNNVTRSYVDFTTDYWATPAIASHRGASQFLVVAAKGLPTANIRLIWGRTMTWNGATTLNASAQFPIHQLGTGKNPDVGGNPNPSPSAPSGYCVTWDGTSDGELYYNLVRTDSSLLWPNAIRLDPGSEFVSNPAISKSCGLGALASQEWLIVWQKRYSPTDEDIHGTRIGVDGAVRTLDFLIDFSSLNDTNPEVSSLTDTTGAGAERFAVVYQRDFPSTPLSPGHTDIIGQLFATTASVTGPVNLTALLGGSIFDNHYDACIDTDGQRFAIGFTQWGSIFSPNTEPYLATLHIANDAFAVTSLPELVNGYLGHDEHMHITSERSGGTFTPRYMASLHTEHTPTPPSGAGGVGAFYFGHISLSSASYFNHSLPGCGSITLTPSGLPALASVFQLDISGHQGIPFLLFGDWLAAPVNVCPSCVLGVDPGTATVLNTTSVSVFVPPQTNLIGLQVGAQALDLLAPGGCTSPLDFTLSDMLLITLL